MLLRLDGVAKGFAGRELFRDVGFELKAGDRLGLIGPNGAGKTTLLRIAAGEEPPDRGRVSRPRRVRVGTLRQEIDPTRDRAVRDEAASVFARLDELETEMRELEDEMARAGRAGHDVSPELADRYDRCRASFEFGGGFEREARVDRMLEGLGFDAERRARPLSSFSGGWLMRVELAKLLLSAPDVLLLDEPTNHLDLPSIEWFEEVLTEFRGAAMIVSHDRAFLRRHVGRVAELELGTCTVYEGNYDVFVRQKEERRELMRARKRSQDRKIAQTERFIERFRYKNTKARQVQSRVKALERMERVEVPEERERRMRLRIPSAARSGGVVLRLQDVHKSYGDTVVYTGVDVQLRRGECVALVGPNGAGKSTLLRIAAGVLELDAGERRLGHNVRVGFFAQHQVEALDAGRTVLAELESVATSDDVPRLRGHLGAFLFSGDDVEKKVSVLSGGEKSRLALAKMLLHPANLLVLDEPTNHLDLAACEVLERALASYTGTLLFISHDRTFIDALATRVIEVKAGTLRVFLGGYGDYMASLSPPRSEVERTATPPGGDGSEAAPAAPTGKQQRIEARARTREAARRLERSRKRLAAVEEEIAQGEGRLESISWRLGDPEVHRDGDAVRALEAQRGETRAAVDGLYAEWERLAAEIEAAEDA